MKLPEECDHLTPELILEAQWIVGEPTYTFARYMCPDCGYQWDDPTEEPTVQVMLDWKLE